MITQKKTANVLGGKTARACQSCLKKRARWFCPADDAFLCHACDSLVHSANELAGRHKRVRLETASFRDCTHTFKSISEPGVPSWHQGFTRKSRTPRGHTKGRPSNKDHHNSSSMPVVPEMSSDEGGSIEEEEENEEHMIFSVPTFEPFEVELNDDTLHTNEEFNISFIGCTNNNNNNEWDNLPHEFLPKDNDLAEFAASLLEQGPDEKMYAVLPLTDKESESVPQRSSSFFLLEDEIKAEDDRHHDRNNLPTYNSNSNSNNNWEVVKVEDQEGESTTECGHYCYDWSMDVASHDDEILNFEDQEEKKLEMGMMEMEENWQVAKKRRKIFLRLNYEEVINAWAGNSSPWTTGRRPEFDPDRDGWPQCMVLPPLVLCYYSFSISYH